jgi:hypothetical protein
MSDDFENIDQIIFPTVSRDAAERGSTGRRRDSQGIRPQAVKRQPIQWELRGLPPVDVSEEKFSNTGASMPAVPG